MSVEVLYQKLGTREIKPEVEGWNTELGLGEERTREREREDWT